MKIYVRYEILLIRDFESQIIKCENYHYGKENADRLRFFLIGYDVSFRMVTTEWDKEDEDGCPVQEKEKYTNLEF